MKTKGLVTIPTDKTFAEGTKKYIKMWGADAVRDCDGVTLPEWLVNKGYEISYPLTISAILRQLEQYTTMAAISRA